MKKQDRRNGHPTHGDSKTPLYHRWTAMRRRCTDRNQPYFQNYGGRGIKVCKRWNRYENFKADMGATFKPELTLERRNNNKGYYPKNCYWATRAVQARNSRQNVWLSLNGVTLCMTDWARRLGITRLTIFKRLARGWSVERALTK